MMVRNGGKKNDFWLGISERKEKNEGEELGMYYSACFISSFGG